MLFSLLPPAALSRNHQSTVEVLYQQFLSYTATRKERKDRNILTQEALEKVAASRPHPLCRGTPVLGFPCPKGRGRNVPEGRPGGLCPWLPARRLRTPRRQAAQPGCLGPATAAGKESPGLKLASGSPPRQFHHSLWQTRPCGEVMTRSLSGPGQQGVRRRQHRAKPHFLIMVSLRLELGKQGKQEHPCMWDVTFALLLFFLHACAYRAPCPILHSRHAKERKAHFLRV